MGIFGWGKDKDKNPEVTQEQHEDKVNLIKTRVNLVKKISLEKGISDTQTSRVALVLDYSFSMEKLYTTGFVQKLVERLMPLGIRFDDNAAIDVFIFATKANEIGEVTLDEFEGFVNREISSKYSMGGTRYAPIIDMVTNKYKLEPGDVAYVMFITDGDNSDKVETNKSITEAAKVGVFWQFIGIGNASFNYLEKLDNMEGRIIDNANFFQVDNLDRMTDEDLYGKMMDEYPEYLQKAKALNII